MRALVLAFMAIAIWSVVSCAGNPVDPSLKYEPARAKAGSNRVLWGLYNVIVQPSGEVQIVPMRTASFNCNVQQFLSPPYSPVNLLTLEVLPSSIPSEGYLELNIGLRNPFPGLNQYRGFDVRGIFMADGSIPGEHDPDIMYAMPLPNGGPADEAYMLNPDGYTRWWNPTEFTDPSAILSFKPGKLGNNPDPTATLNPFKYFADGLGADDDVAFMDTVNRGSFGADGEVKSRKYMIQFAMAGASPVYQFNYAVDASWAQPDSSFSPDYPIESFPPEAQTQEPYHTSVSSDESSMYYTESVSGGDLRIKIEIFDWQAQVDPMGVSGEISSIWLEGGPIASPVDVLPLASVSPGAASTSSVFEIDLDSSYLSISSAGRFFILGTIESVDPDNYMPQIPGGENFVYPQDAVLSAYFMAQVEVGTELPQLQVITPNGGESWAVGSEQDIVWSGGADLASVTIEYSKDDFVTDIHTIVTDTENDGMFHWDLVPDDVSDTVKVRVRSESIPAFHDESDQVFSIIASLAEMIVYAADGPEQGRHIYSIDPEGIGTPKKWSNQDGIFNEGPKLSPDGTKIIYTSLKMDFSCKIIIVDVATGVETDITPPGYDAIYGDFQNTGNRIVSALGTFGYPLDLWTLDLDGGNSVQLSTGLDAWAPTYNIDDTKIYYSRFSDSQVFIYDVASGDVTQYTDNGAWNDDPTGSPDGTQIAWATSYGNGGRHIFISPIDSWNPPDIEIGFEQYIRSPDFSPDGTKVVFDHGGFGGSELGIYEISTETWKDITSNAWGDYMADWGYMIPN